MFECVLRDTLVGHLREMHKMPVATCSFGSDTYVCVCNPWLQTRVDVHCNEMFNVLLHSEAVKEFEVNSERFTGFIRRLTCFSNRLSELNGTLLDEVCVAIPPKAQQEVVAQHQSRLMVCLSHKQQTLIVII